MLFVQAFSSFLAKSKFAHLSGSDVTVARRAFLDGTGTSLAGATTEAGTKILAHTREHGGSGPARVIGSGLRTSPLHAALANGVLAHSVDYDDVNHPMMGHPTAVLLPVIYALADLEGLSGREAIVSYAVGLELAAKLGRIVNPWHYEQGWHATSTLGTLAAAAAAAKVLDLDPERIETALALAASLASGLRRNFGSMAKPFHAGHAARCGLESALLASRGFTASREVLEGEMGLFALFGKRPSRAMIKKMADELGRPYELTASGLAVKQYPCCAGAHPAVDAALSLRRELQWKADAPDRVLVRVHPLLPRMMIYDRPRTSLQAKFSLRYCVAAALEDGRLNRASFTGAALARSSVRSWMMKTDIRPDLGREGVKGEIPTRAEVVFCWQGGRRLKKVVAKPVGSPDKPLPDEIMADKFEDCARGLLGRERVRRLLSLFSDLENVADLRQITRRLVSARKPCRIAAAG